MSKSSFSKAPLAGWTVIAMWFKEQTLIFLKLKIQMLVEAVGWGPRLKIQMLVEGLGWGSRLKIQMSVVGLGWGSSETVFVKCLSALCAVEFGFEGLGEVCPTSTFCMNIPEIRNTPGPTYFRHSVTQPEPSLDGKQYNDVLLRVFEFKDDIFLHMQFLFSLQMLIQPLMSE